MEVQTVSGRAKLFNSSYADLELEVRRQLQQMFGDAGFDAKRDIAGIIFNRQSWGRAAPESRRAFKQVLEVLA